MSTAPRTSAITFEGPIGPLEGIVDAPDARPVAAAVVCHPHPLYGGNMTNKVTHILARAYNDLGAVTLRFNFRGVGASAGTHDDGRGETEDVLAALRFAEDRWPNTPIWLAGFSFGAAMALRAAMQRRVAKLVTVAPALRWLTQIERAPDCPWLIVQGDADELVDAHAVRAWAQRLSQPPTLHILPGVEHFFHGKLNDLRDIVKAWMQEGETPTR